MKKLDLVLRILFALLLLIPITGSLGLMPPPTADMYSTEAGWLFMSALMNVPYMMPIIGLTCGVCALLFFMNKTALAAILLAPFTVNVILFHLFLDASVISAAATPAYILVVLNAYFLWRNKEKYEVLWK